MIVQLLAEARSLRSVRLRVFMTSRPEIPIRHGFDKSRRLNATTSYFTTYPRQL
jgi:hypothetical protein